jgi:hypothetical protein
MLSAGTNSVGGHEMNAHIHAQLANIAVADRLRAAGRAQAVRDARGTQDAVARRRHRQPGTLRRAIVARRLRVLARPRTA